ncbi:MAG TPA: site-2 protease family protein [Candidatus Acidoferrales bacterium]|nr:site-2 protease family protein [Candidatus Acidoferrales bacterium]
MSGPSFGNVIPGTSADLERLQAEWISHAYPEPPPAPKRSLVTAILLLLVTACTCLAAGAQFAASYANNQAASTEEYIRAFKTLFVHPGQLTSGLPFAATLLTILLAHELGHYFACRHHRIRSSYPLFIPFPSLIGTFGAFILIRSAIRTRRALFDVGASGPLVGFVFAIPALVYGVMHAKFVPGMANTGKMEFVFGVPLAVKLIAALVHPGVPAKLLLLDPVGRAAWVGLFATSLNLLPSGQLDGGHILRSVSTRVHWAVSWILPLLLVALGLLQNWSGWFIWAGLLFALRFLRMPPIYDAAPLDRTRRWIAVIALIVFVLSFMPAPVLSSAAN